MKCPGVTSEPAVFLGCQGPRNAPTLFLESGQCLSSPLVTLLSPVGPGWERPSQTGAPRAPAPRGAHSHSLFLFLSPSCICEGTLELVPPLKLLKTLKLLPSLLKTLKL